MKAGLKIVQFTDFHLFGSGEGRLCGLDTFQTLCDTLKLAREDNRPPDLIFLTGDNSQDATPESYERLASLFSGEKSPVYCLPGNHDSLPMMKLILGKKNFLIRRFFSKNSWQFVFLDSTVENSPKGYLRKEELDFLDSTIEEHPAKHTLICLHHQPVPVGSVWMDTMEVDNFEKLFEVLRPHQNVRGILFGHVHQEYSSEREGKLLLGSPSTCFQFKPGQEKFSLDNLPPGYRWLHLLPDGRIQTGVRRLPRVPADLNLDTQGY